MSSEINPNYIKAGQITREVRALVEARKDWRGTSYLDLCNFVEDNIRKRGGEPAFPTNICIDESAAHYTAGLEETKIIGQDVKILKVDLGAHVDGFPGDTSTTFCYDEDLLYMLETAKGAQTEALKVIRAGSKASEVGRVVEAYSKKRGYIPISNLTGHSMEQYVLHSGLSVPNVWTPSAESFKLGKVYAVEHFLTTREGAGEVVNGKPGNIFAIVMRKKTKDQKMNELIDLIWEKRRTLPFAFRWFQQDYSVKQLNEMIEQLRKMRIIHTYEELIERNAMPVVQVEHTIAVTSSGPIVLT